MSTKQKIFIPTYISSVDYAPARVQPRILFYNGPKDCETYYIRSGSTATTFDSFPYFDNYSGQNTTTESLSLLFNNEVAPYGELPTSSLYTQYWENYINLLYNPRTRLLNASAIIPLADYFKMELNGIAQFRGNYYHIRAINDYNLTTGECNIQLLGPVLEGSLNFDIDFECGFNYTSSIVTTTTAPPTTTTSTTVDPTSIMQYLIVGGGGKGGFYNGGGAGGFVTGSKSITNNTAYLVNVGTGSSGAERGGYSYFDGEIAYGGGSGGNNTVKSGYPGGSGGGSYGGFDGAAGCPGQGNSGGQGNTTNAGGGGGGASDAGGNVYSIKPPFNPLQIYGGEGGDGAQWLNGNYYAGGGSATGPFGGGGGGIGGGGGVTQNGGVNTGGGGGATGGVSGATGFGGSGIVIVRYLGAQQANGGTITSADGYTYHTFTSGSGALIFGSVDPLPTTTTTIAPTPCNYYELQNVRTTSNAYSYIQCNGAVTTFNFAPGQAIRVCAENITDVPGDGITVTLLGICPFVGGCS